MADFKYTYDIDQFPNHKVDTDTLLKEIQASRITVAIDYITEYAAHEDNFFKAELSPADVSILNDIVANHTGEPEPEAIPIVKSEQLTEHIRFVEQGDTTQGLYAAQSLIVDISAGQSEKVTDFTWPFDIALMSGTLGVSEDMVGDDLHIHVGPNTLIGASVAPLSVGDTSIYVSPTVMENIRVGYFIGVYVPGPDGIEISQVLDIDEYNACLTIYPADVSINAGTYLSMCAKIIPQLYLHNQDKVEIGKDLPTGQRIPKDLPVRVHYHNNNGVAKKISFFVEYLY